jgi:L-asparaginase
MGDSLEKNGKNRGVLVIYTGGTIGSAPRDPFDVDSPKTVVPWDKLWSATPELNRLTERGCLVDYKAFKAPLDSCNVGPEEWTRMAQVIADNYDKYEGFVILHGTDTMAYSASMLSFMLRDLGKPVVFTGAQRSAIADVRNDATQNFITAILVANPTFSRIPVIPEVVICFGGLILRGNRTIKNDTSGYTAYQSPNLEPIGETGERIVVNERLLRPAPGLERRFHIRTRLNTNVMPLYICPGISTELIIKQLSVPNLRAVVVQSFGTGNIPTRPDILEAFRKARQENNIILANVSQCRKGPVTLGMYESSAELLEAGFISAGDLTMEAAQCKLMLLLGDPDMEIEEVEAEYQVSIAGELSTSQYITHLTSSPYRVERSVKQEEPARLRLPGKPLAGHWDPKRMDHAFLRLRQCSVDHPDEQVVELRVFVNLDPEAGLTDFHPNLVGRFRKWPTQEAGLVAFDVTDVVQSIGEPGDRISFTIAVDTPGAAVSFERAELALFIRESGV